mgnify:FL=1|jgi:hypothetical protein
MDRSKPYRIKNTMLAIQSDWMIDQTTLAIIKDSEPEIIKFHEGDGTQELKIPLQEYIKEELPDVYSVPLFTEKFCDMMLDEVKNMEQYLGFSENSDEDELRQIPEITLQDNVPQLSSNLHSVVLNHMNPLFTAVWQRYSLKINSIQLANYNLAKREQGEWHHDASADISVVVPLNTGDYEGGGTEFHGKGVIPPLPRGHALFFPSFTHMHRGLKVGKGDRYLLVFWLLGAYD